MRLERRCEFVLIFKMSAVHHIMSPKTENFQLLRVDGQHTRYKMLKIGCFVVVRALGVTQGR